MKRHTAIKILGVGLGVGLASFGAYRWLTPSPPNPFRANPEEFKSLSEYQATTGSKQDPKHSTVLVLFNLDDDADQNQMLIPATDEITAADLSLDPAMLGPESGDSTEQPVELANSSEQQNSETDGSSESESSTAWKHPVQSQTSTEWTPATAAESSAPGRTSSEWESRSGSEASNDFSPTLPGSSAAKPQSAIALESDLSVSAPAGSEVRADEPTFEPVLQNEGEFSEVSKTERWYEVEGSTWKKNPFADAQEFVKNSPAGLEFPSPNQGVASAPNAAAEFGSKPVTSVIEFTARGSSLPNDEQWSPPQTSLTTNDSSNEFAPASSDAGKTSIARAVETTHLLPSVRPVHNGVVSRLGNLDSGLPNPALTNRSDAQTEPAPLTESVAQRAVQHIEYGKSLARRGSTQVAKQEFYSALSILAQAHDATSGANQHSMALRNGIMALKEAEDFVVQDAESQIGLNVKLVVETHRLDLISAAEQEQMTPIAAMQRYFAYAEKQLEIAGGRNVVAAEALYCLGKLQSVMSTNEPGPTRLSMAKAIVYHRAALASDTQNYRSANELGVLMARSGQLEEAKDLLKQSLLIQPAPQTWNNLAKVHERLGEQNLAQLAQAEFDRAVMAANSGTQAIQWMATGEFNATAPMEFHENVARNPELPLKVEATEDKTSDDDKLLQLPSIGKRIKSLF